MKQLLLIFFISISAFTYAADSEIKPPELPVSSYLLVDYHSGVVLAEKNAKQRLEPASITKIMTAYVVYEALKSGAILSTDRVKISKKAWKMRGSRMFLEQGTRVPLNKLLHGLIIQSGNDAAVAIAEHVAGSETAFVEKMNQTAKNLGMENTHFANATGWPAEGHYTTAEDIVRLSRALMFNFPERYKLYRVKEYTFNSIKQFNRNKLLWKDDSVDGIKTGHTDSAGFCIVASAERNNMRLIAVVLGAENESKRARYAQQVLEFAYKNYQTNKLYEKGSVLSEARIWKGDSETVPAGVLEDFYVTIRKGNYDKLSGYMKLNKQLDAPVKKGDVVGQAIIRDGNQLVTRIPLRALKDVEEGSLWRRLVDNIYKFFAS